MNVALLWRGSAAVAVAGAAALLVSVAAYAFTPLEGHVVRHAVVAGEIPINQMQSAVNAVNPQPDRSCDYTNRCRRDL